MDHSIYIFQLVKKTGSRRVEMIEKITINERDSQYYTYSDSRDGYLICLQENCSLDDFYTAAKVEPGSYASIIITRLYRGLMTSSVNVNEEYKKYYSKEYDNFIHFLFWKYCIPINISRKFLSQLLQGEVILYNTFSSGCSKTANVFIEDDIMFKSLNKILDEIRKMYHEDSK